MAYVAPTIRSVGDAVTAADYNIMANNALQFAPFVQGVFTTEAARDAAITSPTEGMHAYLTAPTVPAATGDTYSAVPTGIQTIYNGSSWVCVTPVSADTDTGGTTTSGTATPTLTSGGTNPTVTLTTGTSALMQYSAFLQNSSQATTNLTVSISGATTRAATNAASFDQFNAGWGSTVSRSLVITGLTAGTNTFTLNYHRQSSGTLTAAQRSITVQGVA